MRRRTKFALGALVIAAALGGLMVVGARQAVVYFVTPSELLAEGPKAGDRTFRVGGMVVAGSLWKNTGTGELGFELSDGKMAIPVRHRGIPPDLFGEGRGAVVEGKYDGQGTFRSTQILAKHSEEYAAPSDGPANGGLQDLARTLGDASTTAR